RVGEQGLGRTGDALERHVAATEQRDDQTGHHGVLADDRLGDLGAQRRERRTGLLALPPRLLGDGARRGGARSARAAGHVVLPELRWMVQDWRTCLSRSSRTSLRAMSPASSKGSGPYSAAPTYVSS